MKYLIIGAGGTGGAIAGYLKKRELTPKLSREAELLKR